MVKYDPKILQKYAEILYSRARRIIFEITAVFALAGFGFGLGVGADLVSNHVAPENRLIGIWLAGITGASVAGIVGYLLGQAIAFWYRLKAQITLCQQQIELNTRPTAHTHQSASFPEIRE